MKIVYIAETEPVKKLTKKEELLEAARLLASRLRNTQASRRKAQRMLEIELNEKAGF